MKNNALKFVVILLIIIFFQCCARNRNIYLYDGAKFYIKEEALSAQQTALNHLVAQVQPFDRPLVAKKLIVSIPTKDAIYADYMFRRSKTNKSSVSRAESARYDYLAQAEYDRQKNTYDIIKKKNIYKATELIEGSYSSIIQPSPTCDTLCSFSSGEASVVMFMLNVKNGKQVFAFDTTLPTGPARTEALLNGVKAFALQ